MCCAFACVLRSTAAAGPVATFTLEDGHVFTRELMDFNEGRFTLRKVEGVRDEVYLERGVRSIDFGEVPVELGPAGGIILPEGPDGVQCLWWAARERHFRTLWKTCWIERQLEGPERLRTFQRQLAARLAEKGLDAEAERDIRLAQVVLLSVFGRPRDEVLEKLRSLAADYRGDGVVQSFVDDLRGREQIRRRGGRRPRPGSRE